MISYRYVKWKYFYQNKTKVMFNRLDGAAEYCFYKQYFVDMFWNNGYPTDLIKIKIINQVLIAKGDII